MATLNTLRTKGGVIVTIVIGIALLAFLLGDLSRADGSFSSRNRRVGQINGTKIDIVEYQSLVDHLSTIQQYMYGTEALSTEDQQRVREMAWEDLINRYSYQPGFHSMGIVTSEAEQVDMVDGAYLSPVITATFSSPETRMFDPALLRNFVGNISQDPSGRTAMLWNYLKDQMNRERENSKYMALVAKGFYVTGLEAQQMAKYANSVSAISYISKSYASIADSTIQVSESEVRDYYKQHKRLFLRKASRDIEYVVFEVIPSDEDYAAAARHAEHMSSEFQASEYPFQYALHNSDQQPDKSFLGAQQLSPELAAFAFGPNSQGMYGPVLDKDVYTLARVSEVKMMPDSIGTRHILLPATATQLADSIETALKAGADFAELARTHSLDDNSKYMGGEMGTYPPEMMIPEFVEAAFGVKQGSYFRANSRYGIQIGQMTFASPLVKKVQLAVVTQEVRPSEATQQAIEASAGQFMKESADSYENFKQAVATQHLTPRVARVYGMDQTIGGIENSREVVRWAFSSKVGAVSGIKDVSSDHVIATLTGATQEGEAHLRDVSAEITQVLRHIKKGEMLSAELSGGASLSDVASKIGAEIKTAPQVEYTSFYVHELGVEPAVIGAVAAVEPGKLSKPAIGSEGVFLFEVTNRMENPMATPASERARMEAMQQNYLGERLFQALSEGSKIKDNRVKFY